MRRSHRSSRFPRRQGSSDSSRISTAATRCSRNPLTSLQSNLAEVGFYVGMLPVIAALTLLTRRWRGRFPRGELRCWYGVMIVGAVLALGAGTPLEHILYHIPFYGSERNAGRNIVDVDLAACALFAWWIDGGTPVEAVRRVEGRRRVESVAAFVPAVFVGVTAVLFLAWPEKLWEWLRAVPPPPTGAVGSGPAIALAGGLAVCAGTLAVIRSRSVRAVWMRWLAVFVVVDVGLFAIGTGYASAQQPPEPAAGGPVAALVKANLSPAGRYGVFDPDLFDSASNVGAERAGCRHPRRSSELLGLRLDRRRPIRARDADPDPRVHRPGMARLGTIPVRGSSGARHRARVLPRRHRGPTRTDFEDQGEGGVSGHRPRSAGREFPAALAATSGLCRSARQAGDPGGRVIRVVVRNDTSTAGRGG